MLVIYVVKVRKLKEKHLFDNVSPLYVTWFARPLDYKSTRVPKTSNPISGSAELTITITLLTSSILLPFFSVHPISQSASHEEQGKCVSHFKHKNNIK